MAERQTLVDKHLNQVVWFGGLPIRRGDMITYLTEQAKELDKDNWFRIREAGMLGNYQFQEKHGYPPEGTEPYTLAEFKLIIGDTESATKVKKQARRSNSRSKRKASSPVSIRMIRG